MYAYRETLSIAGVGGLLAGLDQCADEDFELAIREISQIVPEVVSRTPARAWKVAMHKIAITLSADREYVDLVLLTNELFLHEALAAIEHRGLTQVPRTCTRDAEAGGQYREECAREDLGRSRATGPRADHPDAHGRARHCF